MRELISSMIVVGSLVCACVVPSAASPSPAPDRAPDSTPDSAPTEAAPPPPTPSTTPTAAPTSEAQAFVDAHNRVRAQHCARPLAWSDKLAHIAQRWADALRDKGCAFGHSGGSTGENLAAGTTGTLDADSVVQMWYDEVGAYKFPNGGFSMQTGHFTQVVWRGTTAVGCGRSRCKGMDIFVCEYDPPGNWEGQYRENVLPKSCRKGD
jgi:uncharacterized protein YkwD